MTTSLSRSVAHWKASGKILNLISCGTCAWTINALPWLAIIANPTSAKLFHCGVSLPVYSNAIPSFQSALSAHFCSKQFSPTPSIRQCVTFFPACFHLLNLTQIGSTIPFFHAKNSDVLNPVFSSTMIRQLGLGMCGAFAPNAFVVDMSRYTLICPASSGSAWATWGRDFCLALPPSIFRRALLFLSPSIPVLWPSILLHLLPYGPK